MAKAKQTLGNWMLEKWSILSNEKRSVFNDLASKCRRDSQFKDSVDKEISEAKKKMSSMIQNFMITPEDKKKHLNEFMKSFSEYSEYTQSVLYVKELNHQFVPYESDDVDDLDTMLIRMYRIGMFTDDSVRLGIEWYYSQYTAVCEEKWLPKLFFLHSLLSEKM